MTRIDRNPRFIRLTPGQIRAITEYMRAQPDVAALFLFGSYGTSYQTPLSDVDLAVLPSSTGGSLGFVREAEILAELCAIAGTDDINLVDLASAPVTLQAEILDAGRPLVIKDQELLAELVERVTKRYCDFIVDLEAMYRDYDHGLREEYCRER